MSEIVPQDWLEHQSGRIAQDCAVRLSLACSAVIPSDQNLKMLVEEQVLADLLELAFHGRRTMERRGYTDPTIGNDRLWPASSVVPPADNLSQAFSKIIHASSLELVWEKPDIEPDPYKGRTATFVSFVKVKSDQGEVNLPVGAITATFFGSVLNRMDRTTK